MFNIDIGIFNMADIEYASNSKGNTAVTLGSIGLGLAAANMLGNGGLSGLFGNSNQQALVSEMQAKIAKLESENYSDKANVEVYRQTVNDNNMLEERFAAAIKPLAEEAANNRVELAKLSSKVDCNAEKQALVDQLTAAKINELGLALNGKIDTMNANTNGMFNSVNNTISCINGNLTSLTNRVNSFTQEIIPMSAICPEPMPRYNSYTAPTTGAAG